MITLFSYLLVQTLLTLFQIQLPSSFFFAACARASRSFCFNRAVCPDACCYLEVCLAVFGQELKGRDDTVLRREVRRGVKVCWRADSGGMSAQLETFCVRHQTLRGNRLFL